MSDILSGIVEATLRPKTWSRVCEAIEGRIPGVAAMVFEYELLERRIGARHGSGGALDHDDLVDRLIAGGGRIDEEACLAIATSETGIFGLGADLPGPGPRPAGAENPYRQALFSVLGSQGRGGRGPGGAGMWVDIAVLHAAGPGGALPGGSRAEITPLLPVIGAAMATGRAMRSLNRRYGVLLEFFDRLDIAVGFCDAGMRLVLSNACLRALMAEGDALVLDGERPRACTLEAQQRFCAALGRAGETAMTLPRGSGRQPLVVRTAPLSGDGEAQLTMLLVLDPEDDRRFSSRGLAALRLLTPAELEVCDLLVRGLGTEQISERRATSSTTTRNQVKSAAAKLGCRTRLDLVRLAFATHVPVSERDLSRLP
ncbi:hypothetical protein E0K89_021140 [Aquicoccus sp. SCR17]|nr:hypothetical protein [Carideicomes alvinocaridis]